MATIIDVRRRRAVGTVGPVMVTIARLVVGRAAITVRVRQAVGRDRAAVRAAIISHRRVVGTAAVVRRVQAVDKRGIVPRVPRARPDGVVRREATSIAVAVIATDARTRPIYREQ
jgi:hypothetical protein